MTYEEIIQALRCGEDANGTPRPEPSDEEIVCYDPLKLAAADLIERLTAENADLCKEIEWKDMVIALAQRKQAEAEAERDALREKVPEWVNVASRLPEVWKNERTGELVNYIVRSPYFGVDIGNYHKEAGTWLCMGLPCTVTHWMPLPEAPEVE